MSSSDMKLNLILKAYDGLSSVVKSACTQSKADFDKMNKSLEDTARKFDDIGKKTAIFGGALLGASAVNIKTAGDFEQQMNNVSTLIDTNTESLDEMSKEVLKIGKTSPKALSDLTDGLYSIRSAGISASDQFKVLKGSEMLSVAGLSSTAEAVDVTTSAINAFNLKGKEADKIYNMFFKVVKYGKTNISDFAQGFGATAGVVAAAKIPLDEYSASIAAMTTSGVKASIAHTQIKAAIAGLSRGSKEQMAIFNQLGAKSFSDLVEKSGGMVNAFNKINKVTGGNQARLIQLVGSVEAYNAILSLTGANNKVYLQTLNDMRNGGDSLSEAYSKQADGLNNQMAIMKNNLQALSIKFGTALLPAIKATGEVINKVTGLFDKIPDGLTSFIAIATAGVGTISLFGGTALMFTANVIRSLVFLRKTLLAINIATWANPALIPIIAITAGVTALAAGAVYCYNKFEGFRNICQGVWEVVKAGGAWLAVLGQSFVSGAMNLWNFISPAVKFGVEIFKWITPIGLVIQAIQKLCGWIGSLIQKAGGLRGIGSKIKNWAKDSTEKAQAVNAEIKNSRNVNGSHANGLNYVPFDGYVAETHKGEAILTEDEANIWRSQKTVNNNTSTSPVVVEFKPVVNIQNANSEAKEEFISLLRQYKDELMKIIQEILRRQEARSY
ncbi:MAG: phage tail tape measure protein [Candidatus Gastranaerophilaceae bacterium]